MKIRQARKIIMYQDYYNEKLALSFTVPDGFPSGSTPTTK